MERDFMGLSSRNASVTLKEEITDACKDSTPTRGSGIQWSFSNKVSALPQFLSFKAAQEDKQRKSVYDPLASSGFLPMSTADAFDSKHKTYSGVVQKNLILDRQAGTHFVMKTYPFQHFDAQPVHRPPEVKIFPVSNQPNQTISVAMSAPVLQSHLASTGQNMVGSTINPQPLGGVPITAPASIPPTTGSIVGTTDIRNDSKPSGVPAQLTIFYAGSVNVYDDITPEKAQAIMLLAGNGPSVAPKTTSPTAQVQLPIPKPSTVDSFIGNQSCTTSPCSGLPSPISVSSHTASQSRGGSSSNNELISVKPIGTLASPANQPEPPKAVSSLGSATATLIPSAVPQARKASLARFLEKRKERAMNTLPYNVSKKSPESCTPGSDSASFSVNSLGSSPLPAIN